MADLSPVETLRAAAAELRAERLKTLNEEELQGLAEFVADWLETYARRYVHWQDARRSPDFAHPYAVACVVLGVSDDAA